MNTIVIEAAQEPPALLQVSDEFSADLFTSLIADGTLSAFNPSVSLYQGSPQTLKCSVRWLSEDSFEVYSERERTNCSGEALPEALEALSA